LLLIIIHLPSLFL